jgi:hypothetical protein
MEPIGYIPPAEAEERYQATLDRPAMAAGLKPNSLRQTRRGSLSIMRRGRSASLDDCPVSASIGR